jgi:microcystin-dependent protein
MLSKTNVKPFAKLLEFKNGLSNVQTNGDNFQLGVDDANLYLEENVIVQGPMTCVSTLNVSGSATFEGQVNIRTLNVSNTSTLRGVVSMGSSLNVSGVSTLDGAVTIKSSLNVSGVCTLQGAATELSTLNVSGITTINNTLKAQEVHQQYATNSFALLVPTGSVMSYTGATAPNGWLLCDGLAVSRTTYDTLFAILGTTYGSGNGSTTFNLPNMKGRVIVGYNSAETEFNSLGNTGGAKTHTLTTSEMPSHNHSITDNGHTHTLNNASNVVRASGGGSDIDTGAAGGIDSGNSVDTISVISSSTGITINNTGGGQAHNILQPYITLNYIIKI